jgi:hypothetical protein
MADEFELQKHSNFLCIFGCPPSRGVPVASTIAVNFETVLMKYLNENGGVWDDDFVFSFKKVQKQVSCRSDAS